MADKKKMTTAESATKKPAPNPSVAKPSVAKAASPAPSGPRDTASILAAARKSPKPGPMSKAEAAAKSQSGTSPAVEAKPRIVVPPMPEPDYATGSPAGKPADATTKEASDDSRRGFMRTGFWALGGIGTVWILAAVRFMFPNVLREPPSKFKVGFPDAFSVGQVQTKFKARYGIWIVNTTCNGQQQLVALKSVCTHLGCTPSWLEGEQKFKCRCHGSGFYKDGVNFEGPAPRPLERYAIRIADDGQIEIDKSQTFQEEMGQWNDQSCFVSV